MALTEADLNLLGIAVSKSRPALLGVALKDAHPAILTAAVTKVRNAPKEDHF